MRAHRRYVHGGRTLRPDVLVTWPRGCDYPLWRKFIKEERARFTRVLIAFTASGATLHDYAGRVYADLAPHGVETFDSAGGEKDWRDVAVNEMLDRSDAERVLFMEQDFRVLSPIFWSVIESCGRAEFGWRDENRWHPSFLLLERETVDEAGAYFGPEPVDHFYEFGRELGEHGIEDLEKYGLKRGEAWAHMQGLSRNHELLDQDAPALIFKPAEFQAYLHECLHDEAALFEPWRTQAMRYLTERRAHGQT